MRWHTRGVRAARPGSEMVHSDPVWRERSDFIIGTVIEGNDSGPMTEQLWARRIDARHFEVCCIPFFAYDLALGDVVRTGRHFTVKKVTAPSGRYVFRVWFGDSDHPSEEVVERLDSLGALLEWSSANLLAVDAVDQQHAQVLADVLKEWQDLGQLVHETGRTR